MPKFAYTATTDSNHLIEGSLVAADRAKVIADLMKQGLRPISIKEQGNKRSSSTTFSGLLAGKVKSTDLVLFTRELSAMVSAGVPLLRALSSLEKHTESPALKRILKALINDVEGGVSLADALGKYPNTFGDVYVNMVRAGEAAGILDEILKRLALQQEKSATIRRKIRGAMSYPAVLVTITIIAFFGLMLFVIPNLGKIIKDLGGPDAELPALTQFMLSISGFMISYWFFLVPGIIVAIIVLIHFLRTPEGKSLFDRFMLGVPGVKGIVAKIAIARFARTFSALIGAGVAVLEALNVTAHSVGNTVYEQALIKVAEEVKNGASLSSVIESNPLFPSIVAQMLAVGEETGQTDVVILKVADFYEEEVDVAIGGISSIIEPMMILIMGSMVGLIAASVMGPIAGLAQNIKG